jgi:hypothetical protein
LDCMSAPFVAADLYEVWHNALQDFVPLVSRTRLEQLLTEVVTIIIDHELPEDILNF